jgi:hypothetical protein
MIDIALITHVVFYSFSSVGRFGSGTGFRMFLCLPDPDPDPLVRDTDPAPDPSLFS